MRRNFAGLSALLAAEAPDGADVILADLGLSSMQIDDPSRGFTFKDDGPLDMRMNPARVAPRRSRGSTRPSWRDSSIRTPTNRAPPRSPPRSFERGNEPLTTTGARRRCSNGLCTPIRREISDAIRRVFQAIRIAVNDEFASLDAFLRALPSCLRPGAESPS